MPAGLVYPDFDKRVLKKQMRKAAPPLVKLAKQLVGKKGVSKAGDFPGKTTGTLRKNIRSRVSKSGFSFSVREDAKKMTPFYPAFVYYGHRAPKSETALERRRHRKRVGGKVAAPRDNWIFAATEVYAKTQWPEVGRAILDAAIKPVTMK
jgi:hypothetical protein